MKIDIEEELIKVQISYMQKEISLIQDMYFTNSEYDLDYVKICNKYEEQLKENNYTIQEQLEVYKDYFKECLELLFTFDDEVVEEVEYIESDKIIEFNEELPF